MRYRRILAAGITAGVTAAITVAMSTSQSEAAEGAVLAGASDIALCDSQGDEATSRLLDQIPGARFTAGDNFQNVPGSGTEVNARTSCFDETDSWGRFSSSIRPVPGNHDYMSDSGRPYYDYFGSQAGERGKGYYSYDLADGWHIVALNSNLCVNSTECEPNPASDPDRATQWKWLRDDLARSTRPCTIAYWHHPLFTSGGPPYGHAGEKKVRPLYQLLYQYGAEIVVNGHNHQYERFAPQDANGNADAEHGIREFVVGTGGASQRRFGSTAANSVERHTGTYGVIKFTLRNGSYDWQFVPVDNTYQQPDERLSGSCHAAP